MRTLCPKWIGLALLFTGASVVPVAWACNVPVFRYALERWPPELYPVIVFHRGPLTSEQQGRVQALRSLADHGLANLEVQEVNLAGSVAEPLQRLWQQQTNARLPWVVVRYPAMTRIEPSIWTGSLRSASTNVLAMSPARQEMSRRLLGGQAAVWLLLESGDQQRDDAVARLLESESAQLAQSLTLPAPDPDDPALRGAWPTNIVFSLLRVSRHDPAEVLLVNLITRPAQGEPQPLAPMVLAVFGRGRALPPLVGPEIQPAALGTYASFVTGPCSCEAKSLNPGLDLLMAADWEAALSVRLVTDPETPPLIGLSQAGSSRTNRPAPGAVVADVSFPAESGAVRRNLLWLLAVGLVGLALGTWLLKRKSG